MATISQLPWTLVVMMPGIKKLNAVAESREMQEKADAREVEGLLREWTWMNVVRGGFALVGGLVGVWAIIDGEK